MLGGHWMTFEEGRRFETLSSSKQVHKLRSESASLHAERRESPKPRSNSIVKISRGRAQVDTQQSSSQGIISKDAAFDTYNFFQKFRRNSKLRRRSNNSR
jgi:hypothetical protein